MTPFFVLVTFNINHDDDDYDDYDNNKGPIQYFVYQDLMQILGKGILCQSFTGFPKSHFLCVDNLEYSL
jgi:hypothetical protein